jgi:hypothetical protein
MIKNEKARIWVNRLVSLIIAGGLMFLIMNYVVAEKIRNELDECKYEAVGLLNDAKASFDKKDYDKAKETLNTLFIKHPDSNETTEGKKVYAEIEDAVKNQEELDTKWEAAVGGIREEWAKTMAVQLRERLKEKAGKEKEELERDMNDILNSEWEKVKEGIREEWEK